MPKSGSKTFQKFIYCPNHHYIHLQKSSRKSYTWFAFTTLPKMASLCRKREICRHIGAYIFKGFSTRMVRKIWAALPRWFCFSKKSCGIFRKRCLRYVISASLPLFMKNFSKTNSPLGVSLTPSYAKVEVKNFSKRFLLHQPLGYSSLKVVKKISYMICLYNFAENGLFLP